MIRRILLAAWLLAIFATSATAAEKFRKISNGELPAVGTGPPIGGDTFAEAQPGDLIIWYPVQGTTPSTQPSPKLYLRGNGNCQWGGPGAIAGTNLAVRYAYTNVLRWNALGTIACDPSVAGECASFDVWAGEVLTFTPSSATANTFLVCGVETYR